MTYKEFLDQAGKNLTFKQLNDGELILYNGANGWPCAIFYPEDDAWGPYMGNVHVKFGGEILELMAELAETVHYERGNIDDTINYHFI